MVEPECVLVSSLFFDHMVLMGLNCLIVLVNVLIWREIRTNGK